MSTYLHINKLMEKLGLGRLISEPVSISGGLLHEMYRVDTISGTYAVKKLNSKIMKRPKAYVHTVNSEKIALALSETIPSVTALNINGNCIHEISGIYFMVFRWQEGRSIFPPDITDEHCHAIGDILGRIHSCNIKLDGIEKEYSIPEPIDWKAYLKIIDEKGLSDENWAVKYRDSIQDLEKWSAHAIQGSAYVSNQNVLSHRDLDPKNVLWDSNTPYIIDWEASGYIDPYQEFIETVEYWADDGAGRLIKANFIAFLSSYREYISFDSVRWDAVFDTSYISTLEWLEYNVRRALGIEAVSEKDKKTGCEQVVKTISSLYEKSSKYSIMKEWLSL